MRSRVTEVALGGAKLALMPLLLLQALRVRQRALELPEANGARRGSLAGRVPNAGVPLRILVVGDSSAAGVGVRQQRDALAAQLARCLVEETGRPVRWQLVARTGHTSGEALQHLSETLLQPADVLVTALGVNDVVRQIPPGRSLAQLQDLFELARERAGVRYWLHSGLPPMQDFPLLPAPLRWVLGAQAAQLNQTVQAALGDQADRGFARAPARLVGTAAAELLAEDGFHPGAAGYRLWAAHLAQHMARRLRRLQRATGEALD